jgi:hypothetical protein
VEGAGEGGFPVADDIKTSIHFRMAMVQSPS